jgi:hypothetical protein
MGEIEKVKNEVATLTTGTLEYDANNSGGRWWLHDGNWCDLEAAGWEVDWFKDGHLVLGPAPPDGRFLGALAGRARKRFADPMEGLEEWMRITSQDPFEEGCNCCGPPHNFRWEGNDGTNKYLSVNYGPVSAEWS